MEPRYQELSSENLAAAIAGRSLEPTMIQIAGIPASGKSTVAAAFARHDFLRLNKDSIRKELYGNESTLGDGDAVSSLHLSRLSDALVQRKSIVEDNTNFLHVHRRKQHEMGWDNGYNGRMLLLFLRVPLEICLERNQKRERHVPEDVIRNMYFRYELPVAYEQHMALIATWGRRENAWLVWL